MKTWKRVLFFVLGLVLLLSLCFYGLIAAAFWGYAPLPGSAELPSGARLVEDGMTAAFLLPAGGRAVALVDCGNDPEAKAILAELARRGAKPDDVRSIFLTHGHGDHTAGCHQFPRAEVMALAQDVGLAAGAETARGLLTRWKKNGPKRAVKVTRVLKDGETVPVGELGLRVFAVPGHTAGSAAYLWGGVLFLGDNAMSCQDGRLAGSPRIFSDSVEENLASLRGLWKRLQEERLEVKTLVPAHSAPQQGTAGLEALAKRR